MTERNDPAVGNTTPGAIEESRRSGAERTATSGVFSGATGVEPEGARPAGMREPSSSTGGQSGTDTVLSQVSNQASSAGEKAADALETGKEKAAGGLDSLASMVRQRGDSMGGGQIQSVASTAAGTIEAGASMLRGEGSGEFTDKLESYIRSKPVESLAIAAGLGFLLSKALR